MHDLLTKPLSYSQIADYLTCRHRWFLRYVLGIRPKVRAMPMEVGDAVHRALAAFLSGSPPEDGLAAWYRDLLAAIPIDDPALNAGANDLYSSAAAITERAIDGIRELGFWTYYLDAVHPTLAAVELELRCPVANWPGGFVAHLDWIAHDPVQGRNWITDFKTRGYFTTDDDENVNLQNPIYQHVAAQNGIETVGTLTFQIKSTPPKRPKRNKDGSMSRSDVACDWKTYQYELIRAGLNPDDYADMQAKLADKTFVVVTPAMRSAEHVANVWTQIVEPAASQMAADLAAWERIRNEGRFDVVPGYFTRHLSPRVCNGCGVRDVCVGALRGWDVLGIIDPARFTVADPDGLRAVFS
jgi:hypothetical protein